MKSAAQPGCGFLLSGFSKIIHGSKELNDLKCSNLSMQIGLSSAVVHMAVKSDISSAAFSTDSIVEMSTSFRAILLCEAVQEQMVRRNKKIPKQISSGILN